MRSAQFWEVDKPAVLRRKRALMGKVLPQPGPVRYKVSHASDLSASLLAAHPHTAGSQQLLCRVLNAR